MAELDKINEKNSVSHKTESVYEEPSIKVDVRVEDTWGIGPNNLNDT